MNQTTSSTSQQILLWLQEAKQLKKIADNCWQADEAYKKVIEEGQLHGVANTLIQEGVETEADLNWLYNNLAAFSVYYLSLAILINRNPKRFLKDPPQQRFIEFIVECGVTLTALQKSFLLRVENRFSLLNNKAQWTITLKADEVKLLKKYMAHDTVTPEQKLALDELYVNLIELAKREFRRNHFNNEQAIS